MSDSDRDEDDYLEESFDLDESVDEESQSLSHKNAVPSQQPLSVKTHLSSVSSSGPSSNPNNSNELPPVTSTKSMASAFGDRSVSFAGTGSSTRLATGKKPKPRPQHLAPRSASTATYSDTFTNDSQSQSLKRRGERKGGGSFPTLQH